MGEAPGYWQIEFTEARIADTRGRLLGALNSHQAPGSHLSLINAILQDGPIERAMAEVSMSFWGDYERTVEEILRADMEGTE